MALQVLGAALDRALTLQHINVNSNKHLFYLNLVGLENLPPHFQRAMRILAMTWWFVAANGDEGKGLVEKGDKPVLSALAALYCQWVTVQVGATLLGFHRHEVEPLWEKLWVKKVKRLAVDLLDMFPDGPPPLPRADGQFMDPEEFHDLIW